MSDSVKKVRVRFAPSPTGFMHIGNFRGALYNYIFAKKTGGDFLLRIEDTDKSRYVDGSVQSLIKSLQWAGLEWSEGPSIIKKQETRNDNQTIESKSYPGILEIGDHGPYVQSERLDIYKKYALELVEKGKAYYCFCEPERLEQMREQQQKEKLPPKYDRYCLTDVTPQQVNENLSNSCKAVVRLKVPESEIIEFEDVVRGKVSFSSNTVDDQVLLKSDGFPTYHLANVVDDHLMRITHVIRGEEWLSSTPKHILLYRAFGWEEPKYAHLPLLLNADKSKLSKRQGDVSVEDYIAKGYLKEAIVNFVAMLGWNPGDGSTQEIFSMNELVEKFELSKVHKAGAVFDVKKLDWINSQYIKKMNTDKMLEFAMPFFEKKEMFKAWNLERETWSVGEKEEYLKKVLLIEQERLNKFADVGDENPYFFKDIEYEKKMLSWKEMTGEQIKESLQKSHDTLAAIDEQGWTREVIENKLLGVAGDKRGDLLWPLRVSLTGAQKSPSPFECAWVLGKTESLKRIEKAISMP